MSNSLDSFLTRIGDVTIERVTPRGGSKPSETNMMTNETATGANINTEPQATNDESSDESSGETTDGEQEKKLDALQSEEIEEIRSEGSGDDMDLDETIDSQIGVRIDSDRQQHHPSQEEDDEEQVNILDTLPLEGAPIEGQEVSEADLLGKPISKDSEDEESMDNEKADGHSAEEEGADSNKRHADSDHSDSAKKKAKKEDSNTEGSTSECELKSEKKLANMRRNIREVMDEAQLDEATLSAQRQEMERLRRVQEQQRIIREVQRQIAINRAQSNKAQTRVISLLQAKQNQAGTTMLSQSSSPSSSSSTTSSTQVRLPSTVLLKVNSGSGTGVQTTQTSGMQAGQIQRRSVDSGMRWQKGRGGYQGAQTSISRVPNRSGAPNMLQQRIRMMTPSVSISPVVPKKEPMDRAEYYSDSEISDVEAEEMIREKQVHAMRKTPGVPKYQRPPKGKDVVTISSSSESSDDDCIVLSDPSGEEETDNEDDPSNSGMHTNDRYNVPDEHGRVLINVGHPETEPDVFLAPQVARIIKPHQIGGIRFLFDNIIETIERYKTSSGFGCILAHSMGLGKTLQIASFCDIFFRCTTAKTVLCIMPINTLQNWLAEFNMWLPYEDPATIVEKQSKATNVKIEPGMDMKHEMKEESCGNQSDISNMSRPISTESAHRFGQDTASQQPMNVMSENPYANPHHGYEPRNIMSGSYMQDSTMMNKNITEPRAPHMPPNYHQGEISQNPLYNANPNSLHNFPDPMKSDPVNCHSMPPGQNMTGPKFGMEHQAIGVMYPGIENRSQGNSMYPDMENRNVAAMYPGMGDHHSAPMYPNYNNTSGTFASYGSQINQHELEQEPKRENMLSGGMLPSQNAEVNVKKEPEEIIKKEDSTSTTKEESTEEKKETIEKVKTPYSVNTPIGMEVRPRHFHLHILNDSHKTMTARAKVIQEWQSSGGVLLIGYELYRQLSLKKPNKAKRKRGQPFKDTVDVEEEDKNKGLLDEMHTALVNPGPDLVICDEGHRIKNSHASISMALKQMRTKRRVVLTGYPLQNNLLEYWCMVDFVRPNYLGTKSEFCNMFERPIQNGQCIDSTPQDIRLMRYRAHVLHALLEGFVQRRSHSVLQMSLPRKEEYILLIRMTTHQRKLYDTFMNQVVKTRAVPNPLKAFAVCCKIWNHPDILYHFLRKRQANEEDDLDLEETIGEKSTAGGKKSKARQSKGESKKSKKATTIKNKPAASVQPNASSSSSNDNAEAENAHNTPKQNNYTNYPMPVSNSGYSNSMHQGSYPPHSYQNYRPNDQSTYYRNDNNNHGEYNHGEFYNNQGQQRYGNQPFQSYTQTSGYNTSQGYANQSQNYMQSNEQSTNHPQRYSGAAAGSDFRSDQNQGNNYEAPGMFPRQSYPYQDQQRNYTPNLNQGPSNYSQVSNQSSFQAQIPNQSANMPMTDYSSYGTNQNQNYTPAPAQTNPIYPRNDAQPLQNSAMGYSVSQQGQPPTQNQTQTTGYLLPPQQGQNTSSGQNRGFSPNQQNQQNLSLQTQSHSYTGQQSQGMSLQNQSHPYSTQVNPTPPQTPQHTFNQASPTTMPQASSHGYIQPNQPNQGPVTQSSMRGYTPAPPGQMNVAQNQSNYPANQPAQNVNAQNQTHRYPPDQQGSASNPQNAVHAGYGHHMVSQATASTQATPYPQQNQQSQQSPAPPSNQTHSGYSSNHPGTMPQIPAAHRYGTAQQTQVAQNQTMTQYPPNQQQQSNPSLGPNDQLYSRPDVAAVSQQTQGYAPTANEFSNDRSGGSTASNSGNNYTVNQPQTQNPVMPSYSSDGSNSAASVGQMKSADDPYWQRNYPQTFRPDQQCNDSYYRDQMNPGVNRYQNNYFSPQNYPNQSYDYANHSSDMNPRPDESAKPSQQSGAHPPPCDKSNKDMTSSIGVQSQPMHSNNFSGALNYPAESNRQSSATPAPRQSGQGINSANSPRLNQSELLKEDEREKEDQLEKDKEDKSDDEILTKDEEKDCKSSPIGKEDPGIPYDWATELMKNYIPGLIDASGKMVIFFCILEEAIKLGDRVLAFSQSLFTLNLIEDFLARNSLKYPDGQTDAWIKNVNYYRLDGSTSALEREKLINEFNNNPKIHLFLVSTRAGSLGINLVGANRAIVFDASWNPCHDTQAVCRVYRYGQQKPCFVYRLVTDNCLERKIYDRQISKQGMADRVVDQCNPDAHLSLKEATTLSWDWEEDSQVQDFSQTKDSYTDEVMHCVLERHSSLLTKQPFHHESLLVDRKDKKLSQAEKRLARRGYELEKMAANCSRPSYNYVPGNTATRAGGLQIRAIRGGDGGGTTPKPVASVRPMQQRGAEGLGPRNVTGSRWIPAEVWQRQGMSAQEMTLPLDVVIPTNSPDKGSIVLKAGQRVMVLKSPKGIYMQLESGKIIAIRTALKLNQQKREEEPKKGVSSMIQRNSKSEVGFPLRNNSAISIIPKSSSSNQTGSRLPSKPSPGPGYKPFGDKEISKRPKPVATAAAKPYLSQVNLTNQVSLSRLPKVKQEPVDHSTLGDNSNSSDGQLRTEQRVEEVRLEDVVAEVSSNTEYSPSNHTRTTNSDTDTSLPKSSEEGTQVYTPDTVSLAQSVQTQHDQSESELPSTIDKQCSPPEKEPSKPDTLTNYGRSFHSQTEKRDTSNDDIIIEESPQVTPQVATQTHMTTPGSMPPSLLTPSPVSSAVSVPSTMSMLPSIAVTSNMSIPSSMPSSIPSSISSSMPSNVPLSISSSMASTMPISSSMSSTMPTPSSMPMPPSMPPVLSVPVRGPETHKSSADSSVVASSTISVCTSTNITSPKNVESTPSMRDNVIQGDPTTPNVPQGYPYAQYPRYYDYSDPRSRSLSNPYGTYFPSVPPHTANPSSRLPIDTTKPQPDLGKPTDERNVMNVPTAYSSQVPSITAKTLTSNSATESKGTDTAAAVTTTVASSSRDETAHIPTAFSHPTSTRYPGPYPPGPYDPYSQHYPPAPGSSAAYPPGAPGYPAYGGPSYNTDYARMYSAFHGPPPPTDPYMHRGYAPPSSHPPNYYSPFPHPPPPYPNYSFLPYPNPNMSSEPQPPAQ
ncbi:Helicase ARIP4 [Formica fusca]